ncbi:transcription elongation factor SPT6-like [Tropilaelaps mercedesae]|uniref:Transcription elongation factor SPT6-like n=1 Tax=Tropilaelaps mercedesae TaxID=418985 RepID=A0A1V9X291_9ACAR|nr:transcription elongation factor SPT6-like [Tropilaelaps mercedesae]
MSDKGGRQTPKDDQKPSANQKNKPVPCILGNSKAVKIKRSSGEKGELTDHRVVVQSKRKKQTSQAKLQGVDQRRSADNRTTEGNPPEQARVRSANRKVNTGTPLRGPAQQGCGEPDKPGRDALDSYNTVSGNKVKPPNTSSLLIEGRRSYGRRQKVFLKYCQSLHAENSLESESIAEIQYFSEVSDLRPLGNITEVVPFPELDYYPDVSREKKPSVHEFLSSNVTETDQEIALKDEPERYQMRPVPVLLADVEELEDEAKWIFQQCFATPTISLQTLMHVSVPPAVIDDEISLENARYPAHQPPGGRRNPSCVLEIFEALKCIRQQQLDIPFINKYRKELIGDLCIYDLWLIYKWDERWCRLNYAKLGMEKVLREVCKHRETLVELGYRSKLRKIQESDFQRVREVQTPEELRDIYQHFVLYYGYELPGMAIAFQRLMMNIEDLLRKYGQRKSLDLVPALAIADPEGTRSSSSGPSCQHADRHERRFLTEGAYAMLRRTPSYLIAQYFGLTPEEFGENFCDDCRYHTVFACPMGPLETSAMFVSDEFKTPEEALRAARYIIARQIAHDPIVRRVVRKAFFEQAKLNVKPSKEGRLKLTEADPVYPLMYLKDKPVRSLKTDEYLKLKLMEDDDLLEISIRIDCQGVSSKHESAYIQKAYYAYRCESRSSADALWNKERESALRTAFYGILYPMLEEELKCRLLREANDHVLLACSNKLNSWLNVAPYVASPSIQAVKGFDMSSGPRILGFAYAKNEEKTACGVLTTREDGAKEVIRLNYFVRRPRALRPMGEIMAFDEVKRLKEVLLEEKPHCIVIGAHDRTAPKFKASMEEVIGELSRERKFPPIEVFLLEDNVAKAFSTSSSSEMEFPNRSPQIKEAASLARRMLDPLCEFAQLCDTKAGMSKLTYHALQANVPPEDLYWVGIDLNRCCLYFRTLVMLQFVSGFGYCKMRHMIRSYVANPIPLTKRSDLMSKLKLGPKSYLNAAAFFRIVPTSLPDGLRGNVSILDNSRIHPEMYRYIVGLARRELKSDIKDPKKAVRNVADRHCGQISLEELCALMRNHVFNKKLATLKDIEAELKESFADSRGAYVEPDNASLFYTMIGETPQTFYEGQLVSFEVTGKKMGPKQNLTKRDISRMTPILSTETYLYGCPVCLKNDFEDAAAVESHLLEECPGQVLGVEIRLTNGAEGFILMKYLPTRGDTIPYEWFECGRPGQGRIIRINFEELNVELTLRSSDIVDKNGLFRPRKDQYYDYDLESEHRSHMRDTESTEANRKFDSFLQLHPSCRVLTYDEVCELLRVKEQGHVVCWPSPKGMPFVSLTWKIHKDIYQTLEVKKAKKKSGVAVCEVDGEEFRGIGDIIARHIYPMAAYARQIFEHRYFDGFDGKNKARQWLSAHKSSQIGDRKNKATFCFSAFSQYPGKLLLSYRGEDAVGFDAVTLTPAGFLCRHRMFHSVSALIKWRLDHI